MTHKRLMLAYHSWAKQFDLDVADEIDAHMFYSRDILDAANQRVTEIYYSVGSYTDKLHLFTYSELITIAKNPQGDDAEITAREYLVHLIT